MLAKEENELITDTNRGTPMGEVFRRFWLPVALADELPSPDCVPLRVKVMGEDLIAFRDSNGNVGLVDAYCPHRGAPLFFGRNEEAGLRCVYHGWKFDVNGRCVDIPNMPEGDTYRDKIQIKRYPVVEEGDLLWAYMGPATPQPPFPHFHWADMPKSHRFVTKYKPGVQLSAGHGGRLRPDPRPLPAQHPGPRTPATPATSCAVTASPTWASALTQRTSIQRQSAAAAYASCPGRTCRTATLACG